MKSENRIPACYKKGTSDWKAEQNMLLEDGLTCKDCAHCYRCTSMFGQNETDTKCQFYPNRFMPAKPETEETPKEIKAVSYTPGPWNVGRPGTVISNFMPEDAPKGANDIEYYGGFLICETITRSNARLVSAAPEMLEILKTFVASMDVRELDDLVGKAEAVIAKAEGRAE